MALEDITRQEENFIKKIRKANLTSDEVNFIFKKPIIPKKGKAKRVKGKTVRFGVFGDSHIGHQCYDADLMKEAISTFNKSVDFVIHTGDVCEGHYEGHRQGSVFELDEIGGDNQVKRAIKELSPLKVPLYFITGNHETNTFFKTSGFDIGERLEAELPNANYLGRGDGSINLDKNKRIEIIHPDGGTAYAISYRPQKIAESLEGGTKPSVLLIGHFHKAEYLFYRNIHIFQTGTIESQTPFMRNKHLSAHKGYWTVELELSNDGIDKVSPNFYPRY